MNERQAQAICAEIGVTLDRLLQAFPQAASTADPMLEIDRMLELDPGSFARATARILGVSLSLPATH